MSNGISVRPVTVSMHVPADPDTVFAYVADTRNDPEWCPNVTVVEQTAGDGVAIGSRFTFHQVVEARGRSLESEVEVEVTDLDRHSIGWRVEDRFQTREVNLRVDPDGDEAKITQTTAATFKRKPGLARWVYPMLAKRTFKDQFSRLADHFAG